MRPFTGQTTTSAVRPSSQDSSSHPFLQIPLFKPSLLCCVFCSCSLSPVKPASWWFGWCLLGGRRQSTHALQNKESSR